VHGLEAGSDHLQHGARVGQHGQHGRNMRFLRFFI
jgi:hypothetical protein